MTARTTRTAGRFSTFPVSSKCCCFSLQSTGAPTHAFGRSTPNASWKKATTYPDQPTLTADAATRYSRIKSHPMIQATSSPMVAYEYVYALPEIGIIDAISE